MVICAFPSIAWISMVGNNKANIGQGGSARADRSRCVATARSKRNQAEYIVFWQRADFWTLQRDLIHFIFLHKNDSD